ncbi:MAG: sigma-70 family RNA polymerase sigma factor [Micropepsaceae bacterium]
MTDQFRNQYPQAARLLISGPNAPGARPELTGTSPDVALNADEDFRKRLVETIPYLRAFAQTLCRNRDVADDLAQESITNAWQARKSFQPGTNLKAWLFVIQRNAFYSAHRRKWRQVEWDEVTMDRMLVTPGAQEHGVNLTDLRRAMSTLPDEQREALILVGAGGFSYQEAADICSCAVGTMKSRVSRARSTLDKLISGTSPLPPSKESASSAYLGISSELAKLSTKGPASQTRRQAPK